MWMPELTFIPPSKTNNKQIYKGALNPIRCGPIQTEYAELAAENGHLLMAKFFDYKFQPGKRSVFSLPFLKDNMISPMNNRSNHDVIHLIGSTNGSPTYRLTTTDI